jgi:hypothetical protein
VTDVGWEIIEKLTRVLEIDPADPALAERPRGTAEHVRHFRPIRPDPSQGLFTAPA